MKIIFDSSTLILTAKVEFLRFIAESIQIIIPEIVRKECTEKDYFDARLISNLIKEKKIKIIKVKKKELTNKLCKDFNLHEGEAEALSLALETGCPLAADDLPAIKARKILNQNFTTAIHLLINVAGQGKIDEKTALLKLKKLSLYGRYNKQIIDDAKQRLKGGSLWE